ncbi:MAG: HAD family hydrolase [Chloroflexi bacterium]|jgi:phosphoglycolate phosphatase-like HAD superfamily hydrolase|nr:HAD family hydrolase [Chloroflexota bacterium]
MTLDLSRIRALCFDVDGTLSDTDDQFVHKVAKNLQPLKFLFPNNDPLSFARRFVMTVESPGNFLFGIPDQLGFDSVLAKMGDTLYSLGLGKDPKPFLLIQGVQQMLAQLGEVYPLAVVSARGERSTGWFLDQFELRDHFRCIATAQTCRYTKPHPDPIEWAAEQIGVAPHECLMIGDTTVDILAAKAAGAQSVGVLCGFGEKDELLEAGADLILEQTAELVGKLIAQ